MERDSDCLFIVLKLSMNGEKKFKSNLSLYTNKVFVTKHIADSY